MPISYLTGDVTSHDGDGATIVAHVCNDEGRWGAGVSGAIGRRWPAAEGAYRALAQRRPGGLDLGFVQFERVSTTIVVANMIAQHGIRRARDPGPAPIRYDALGLCLKSVAARATELHARVIGPRFGAGLSGGDWRIIESLIEQFLVAQGVEVHIYDLPSR